MIDIVSQDSTSLSSCRRPGLEGHTLPGRGGNSKCHLHTAGLHRGSGTGRSICCRSTFSPAGRRSCTWILWPWREISAIWVFRQWPMVDGLAGAL